MDNNKCCYTCTHYVDALCMITNDHDDEDPDTFYCEDYEEDEYE